MKKLPLTYSERREVSHEASADLRTVDRVLEGHAVRGEALVRRIRAALARRGIQVPKTRWRPPEKPEVASEGSGGER
ncbi:MAG TPA: hypothetical protein VMK12_25850 [Anaeromyxobacteraceae bacterium]|nr:hypothetical protein [Anaeromyxobacteraceae bacterium]